MAKNVMSSKVYLSFEQLRLFDQKSFDLKGVFDKKTYFIKKFYFIIPFDYGLYIFKR